VRAKVCGICDEPILHGEPHKRHTVKRRFVGDPPEFHTHDRCREQPTVVPFIAAWSGERGILEPRVVARITGGIGYVGEVPEDRDNGVLWRRFIDRQGHGRPLYAEVHPGRQRLAMRHELCQVCGEPADRSDDGVLWLLEARRHDWKGWPNGMTTSHPPICVPCVPIARAQCRHLWSGAVVVRAGRSEVCGVYGQVYKPGPFGPQRVLDDTVLFEVGPEIAWTIGAQLVRVLYDCSFVTRDELRATRL
jgi:hypothetical protein